MVAYRCNICGVMVEGFGAFGNHKQAHKRAGESDSTPTPKVRRPRRRRIESVLGSVDGVPVVPAEPSDTGAAGVDPAPRQAPEPSTTRPSRPSVNAATIRVSPEYTAQSVREAIRDAMPVDTLAMLLRSLSVAVSEADGAGPAGYLSEIQSTQIATLLYDATVDLVITRFKGDVTMFKAAMAVILILVSKGTVHARAIRAKVAERRAAAQATAVLQNAEEVLSPIELAMRRQAATPITNEESIG